VNLFCDYLVPALRHRADPSCPTSWKLTYRLRADAEEAARYWQARSYFCRACDGWHLSKRPDPDHAKEVACHS
jgi:hypothetical protein